jgi:hypothetical protein
MPIFIGTGFTGDATKNLPTGSQAKVGYIDI